MLVGPRMSPGSRYAYTMFIYNDLILSKWGCDMFFFNVGGGFAVNN